MGCVPSLQEAWESFGAPSVTLWGLSQCGRVAPHQLLPGLGPAGTAGSGQGCLGRVC